VMEALGRLIYAAVSGGLLFDFSVGTGNVGGFDISHILFASDMLIFGGQT